ncbi:Store-operated calcium entry-associated regulatory factor [Colletotrichum chlorophyti]|uniref:Store-operated calcium entry-associated regulatory factor n=1 Tax=Colletotrichum chlorophyti TaxID=708187 RepID=A0A1Q8S5N2_9PEZI|nr:Store-operated calcium entry-associated regulatory factor [Colletotrichum chlorophyti]
MILPLALALLLLGPASAAKVPKNAILLSQVQSLTLRGGGAKTTHRRVPPAPQLKCISSRAICNLHDIDVMRCTNQGTGYSSEDIQWSCVASLPEELKLGSTDVICEGYSSPDDPYILRGSCGVEYRLALTEKGERRYPNLGQGRGGGDGEHDWGAYLFAVVFFAVLGWIVYSACVAGAHNRRTGRRRGGGGGGGRPGGGGGGGWNPGFGPDNDDPPPPYPGTKPSDQSSQGWRPGFWSGAGVGGAAGYGAGYYAGRNSRNQGYGTGGWGQDGSSSGSWGAGPSRSSTSSSSGSARHESTGFGSTNRR